MSIAILFLVIALVLFVLASFNVGGPINLTAAGLACLTIYLLAPTLS
jgi:hypothetical protein